MVKLEEYREQVKQILIKYSQYKPSYGEVEIEQIFDIERVGLCPAAGIAIKL
jgi:hypothetical protein